MRPARFTPQQIDAALADLRVALLAADSIEIEGEIGYRETAASTLRPFREFATTGAKRIVITINGCYGGFAGDHDLTDAERCEAILLEADRA